ncbi:MAG: hypothetical protein PHO80_05200, partial [Candidatus Gracilibacteria bacterium]|nr:hypothetical protein [Candidatus Gracilibacteria bacterium]
MEPQELKNLYEVRKTVRFELVPQFIGNNKKPNLNGDNRLKSIFVNLEKLINLHGEFVNLFGETLFYKIKEQKKDENSGNKLIFSKDFLEELNLKNNTIGKINNFSDYEVGSLVQFKYQGLEKVFKNDWIENKKKIKYSIDKEGNEKKKNKNYITLTDLGENNFVKKYFLEWFKNNQDINLQLEKFRFIENDLSRVSDIGFEIQKLNGRHYLGKPYILFEGGYLTHKNDPEIIGELKDKLSQIKILINSLLELTKPSQSFGFPIEHISLNYYTRNKTPKQYDKDIEEKRISLTKPYGGNLGILYGIDKNQPIESLYKEMKTFKAKEKSAFMQLLQKQIEYKDFEGVEYKDYKIQLFTKIEEGEDWKTKEKLSKEDVYNKVLNLTNQIEKETNKSKKTELKVKRGKYYFMGRKCFSNYFNFCEDYKKVAIEYGSRKAKVLTLEREKILAERERGWGFIMKDENNEYFINTIPVENTENVYKYMKEGNLEKKDGKISYFMFSSITLRALDKLCFKKDSSFAKGIKGKIDKKFIKELKNNDGETRIEIKSKNQLIEENLLIKFYNEVLDKQETLKILYRDNEKSINLLQNSKDEDEFEINLKLECYVLREYKTNQEEINELLKNKNGNSYKITSWDLRGKRNKLEEHTKWWFNFWNVENEENKFPLRINPEITISYVEQDKSFAKEKPNQTNNRRTRERYLLNTTLSHKADSKYIDSAFTLEKKQENIDMVNNNLMNYNYFYGLDKGTNELITLGIYKRGENLKIESVNISEKIDIYKITEEGLKTEKIEAKKNPKDGENPNTTHILYKNPSKFLEFINDNNVFEKQNIISCIGNLTSAKVIDGKIILNGDTNTIKKLYEVNAKRFIYILITEQGSSHNEVIFDEE